MTDQGVDAWRSGVSWSEATAPGEHANILTTTFRICRLTYFTILSPTMRPMQLHVFCSKMLRFLSSPYSATPTTATRARYCTNSRRVSISSTRCFRKSDMPCPHNATCAQHPCKTFSRIQGLSVNALISSPPKRVVAALPWTRSLELERQSHAGGFQFPSALEPLLDEEMDWTINDKFGPPASPFLSSCPIMAP